MTFDLCDWSQWWSFMEAPTGVIPTVPRPLSMCSDIHPVVHVSFADALAYAKMVWARIYRRKRNGSLPRAADLTAPEFAWGDEFTPAGVHMANTWQGDFPRP
jgi:formylglycine-generating enzyme required for sulfatase activity